MARTLTVYLVGDASNLHQTLRKADTETKRFGRSVNQSGRGAIAASGAFRSLGRSIAFASGAFLGAAGLVSVLKSSVSAASNLAEQTNKVSVVFGKSAGTITSWGKTTAESIGIANDQALEAAGTFGNLFTTVGLTTQKNAQMSRSLVVLAADLASFNNASPEDTLLALRSGLVGEAEPLRKFGVLLTETRVQQEALHETGKKNVRQLTAQEKVLARYALILKDTSVAQGDFGRTADGLANSQRSVTAMLRDTEAMIGTALMPTVKDITLAIRDWLGDTDNQKRLQHDVNETVRVGGQLISDLEQAFKDLKAVLGPVVKQLGGFENAIKLIVIAYGGLKLAELATRVRAVGTAWGFVAAEANAATAAQQIAAAGGLQQPGFRGRGPGGQLLPGGALGGAAAGAALGLAQRGETSTNIGGVEVGPGGTVAYVDPITGKHILLTGYKGGNLNQFIQRDYRKRHPELTRPATTGEDVAARGAGARGQFPGGGAVGGGAGGAAGPAGFNVRMSKLDIAFSKAQMTQTQRDDRAILVQQAALIRERIGKVKSLKDRKNLYAQLAQVQLQITSIDEEAHQKQVDAAQKHADKLKAQREKLRQAMSDMRDKFASALDAARSGIGELFQGPVLAPSHAQILTHLGFGGAASGIVADTRDIKAQTAQARRFRNDLARLQKAGAPKQLIAELRSQGVEGLPRVEGYLAATKGQRQDLFKAFQGRERFARTVARMEVNATRVVIGSGTKQPIEITVNLDGKVVARSVTHHQQRHKKKTSSGTRGRDGGN